MLGIPWDVDTNGLKEYMVKFGELEDCIVMKVYILAFLGSDLSYKMIYCSSNTFLVSTLF